MRKLLTVTFVLSLVLVSLVLTIPGCQDADLVIFPDAKLEAAVREVINKPTGKLTTTDLATMTFLDVSGRGITDLRGLEHGANLTKLRLENSRITDLSPLAGLTNLTELHLPDNQITDLSPLADLTNLTWLGLAGNQITDIAPLINNSGLGAGDYVDLSGNPLESVTSTQNIHCIEILRGKGVWCAW